MQPHRYFMVHKPIGMVSQFISSHNVPLLGSLDFDFPEGSHAIGRLDKQSEGLLLVTTNPKITRLLFHGKQPHARKYLVQVNNIVEAASVSALANGIAISAPGASTYITQPCLVEVVQKPSYILDNGLRRHPNQQSTWLCITLTEGKFHQVRKMIAAIRHKCLRLIRISIEELSLEGLLPGEVKEVTEEYFFEQLRL